MNMTATEEKKKSSTESPPPPTLFPSLPYDISLNIVARISRIHRPTLPLVSKSFQSLLASRELQARRTLIGKTEKCMYLCLKFKENRKPLWFILAPTPKQQKLIPIPSFPLESPTFVFGKHICLAEIENNVICAVSVTFGELFWRDTNAEYISWWPVTGLEELNIPMYAVVNSCGGRRVRVWWAASGQNKTEIWCSEISLERRGVEEVHGVVEWSKSVFTFNPSAYGGFHCFFQCASITH
ncbi:hypothetical protein AALP_AA8G014800 [Arabis alpina]|uniref:F-box domain-containing protein n=1 Tax=Arabis alpina TaxID=50452 RepID=A0A087G4A8_ARAAL|nr:hypothetical protein AALP_AA8G014800 [Arabis alpina]